MEQLAKQASYTVKVIMDWPDIGQIREFWLSCCPGRDADLELFQFVVEHSPGVLRPHIISVFDDRKLKAILIGRLERVRFPVKLAHFVLFRPEVRLLTFVYGGGLGEISDAIANAFISSIMASLA